MAAEKVLPVDRRAAIDGSGRGVDGQDKVVPAVADRSQGQDGLRRSLRQARARVPGHGIRELRPVGVVVARTRKVEAAVDRASRARCRRGCHPSRRRRRPGTMPDRRPRRRSGRWREGRLRLERSSSIDARRRVIAGDDERKVVVVVGVEVAGDELDARLAVAFADKGRPRQSSESQPSPSTGSSVPVAGRLGGPRCAGWSVRR